MRLNGATGKAGGSKLRTNLLLDSGLLLGVLLVYEPRSTGLTLHEWLGVVIGTVLLVHLLLHWQWITNMTRRFFGKMSHQARLNYGLNITLFVAFTVAFLSGFMISESILPLVGLEAVGGRFWHWLHGIAANLVFWLVALHIALHWKMLLNTLSRYAGVLRQQRIRRTPESAIVDLD